MQEVFLLCHQLELQQWLSRELSGNCFVLYLAQEHRPSLKQPYRSTEMSVPLSQKLKEIYEPQTGRFVANPTKVDPRSDHKLKTTGEGVSVYRTPATRESDLLHLFDGGLERVPHAELLNSHSSKHLTFLQNPSSHFDRLQSPVFYRMVIPRFDLVHAQNSLDSCRETVTTETIFTI